MKKIMVSGTQADSSMLAVEGYRRSIHNKKLYSKKALSAVFRLTGLLHFFGVESSVYLRDIFGLQSFICLGN